MAVGVSLSPEQRERIAYFVPAFIAYQDSGQYESDMAERRARRDLYSQLLAADALPNMTEIEFGQVISSLWASRMWSSKSFIVEQLLRDNGLPKLRTELYNLLWDN